MERITYPVFEEGDRVIGTEAFDDNDDIVGLPGTIKRVEGDNMYSVEYDEEISNGHSCGIDIPYGCGWHTHARALAFYHDEPTEHIISISYDEVMI